MSILEAQSISVPAPVAPSRPPYRRGDHVCATSPEGVRYQLRVETVTLVGSGEFAVVGVVIAPRRFRSHLVSTVVGADGYGPAIQPA
jgi:hypothetical protein